jgi:hypothetical protein
MVSGSYDLRNLAEAIKVFLSKRFSKTPNPDELEQSVSALKEEIKELIKAYD